MFATGDNTSLKLKYFLQGLDLWNRFSHIIHIHCIFWQYLPPLKYYYLLSTGEVCQCKLCTKHITVLSSPSGTVFWWGIRPSSLDQELYLTRQHYRKTVPSEEDNNRIIVNGHYWFSLYISLI